MSAKILPFHRSCPRPSAVVATVEDSVAASINFGAAWWLWWFSLWGIECD
ncbi:MAG: hypothetical protein VW881_05805 [Alphaproteobacteria bacterium]